MDSRVLIVDDDKRIVNLIQEYMKMYDIKSVAAYSGKDALAMLDERVSLIILDINMDDMDGITLCEKIRVTNDVPIIFLSANATQYDKVRGLGVGADDYITKPFDPVVLIAKIKAHLRRAERYGRDSYDRAVEFGDIKVYRNAYKVTAGGEDISLSNTEFKLLLYFIDNAYTALTRKQILYNVWESEVYDEGTVTTYVNRLRSKIDKDEKHIKSVRGVGYIFEK
ncbi:DNA-binding response regulator, OmpR family, contains REC and winged-helix (wHTH) domain [Dethiosulfatibacter aminovorans DSM 17477]|uniref:DNA-binding response regulator, OmpR family, contains REC and winged-helix (WHTH) domain n=1 Tax=Dethiosulfatibacter aminovorans DSM 17477 TaxID=1121476 RepID=A0A1M6BII4_9FIRM|nr:response regulator transcription factor [Dethiosulfatibacter aminovorans]SHI48477.1 DNA-binding response regulator, OmpR family, contains REC and winged-helix (wHTH) domain [Dethiosulfatibacter aminovorans DSM 17477]